jgi:hypothetical protein
VASATLVDVVRQALEEELRPVVDELLEEVVRDLVHERRQPRDLDLFVLTAQREPTQCASNALAKARGSRS